MTIQDQKNKNILKETFLIENMECLCVNYGWHPIKSRKGNYIPGNVYNKTKEIFIKYWKKKRLSGLYSSGDITNLTNHQISESNTKCEIYTRQPWNYIYKNIVIEGNTYFSEDLEQNGR